MINLIEYEEGRNTSGFPRRIRASASVPLGGDPEAIYQGLVAWVQSKLDRELDALEERKQDLARDIQNMMVEKDKLTAEVRTLAAAVSGLATMEGNHP